MSRRYKILAIVVLLLGMMNAWVWGFGNRPAAAPPRHDLAGEFRPEDFHIRAVVQASETTRNVPRDLFRPKLAIVKPPPKKMEQKPPEPPPKTPEQLEEEAARAELAKLKFVGVVFREQKGQAFLVRDDKAYLAFVGDKVADRFVVEQIAADTVSLRDPKTNVSGQLSISDGK